MANPSSVYIEDEDARQTLANGTVLKWTKQLQNIHALNSETDLSIAYTNWANEPMMTQANRGFHQWQGGCVSGGDLGTNQSENWGYQHATGIKQLEGGQPRIDSLQSHVVLSNGGGYYVWGYNPESSTRISGANGDQRRYLLDMDINKMIFNCSITVVDKSFFDNVDFTTNPENMPAPSEHNITLKELYTHPELYYCTGVINWSNTYVYGENTSDKWRGVAIRPCILLTGDTIGEFQGADDSIFGRFNSNGSFSYDSRDPNGHATFGGGGSSNTLYNRMNAGYFMGCKNEMDMTPTDTFDSAGGASTSIALAKWGNTNFNKFAYCNGQIFDYGDSVIWCAWGCRVVNSTDTGSIYRDYTFGTRRYIKADKMLKYIASFGLYFMSESFDPDTASLTPETLGDDSRIMLGEMSADGTTTGRWITDIDSYHGPNKDGKTVNPDYNPSGGGGGGDDDDPSDDQAWGGAYSGAGAFSKFYLCTATDLANLRTWFGGGGSGDQIPDNFDPMGQVLGLLQYPVSIAGTALAPEEITFRSGKTIVHTGVNVDRSTGGFLHIDCGSVEIPRRMQQRGVPFLDFETTLEIYVPFCGTAPLDVQTCVGKTLTCDLYVATATGDVSAVIAAGGHPVAYMSGNMAESLPISSGGYGMYLAACKNAWSNGVTQVMNQLTGGTTDTLKNVNQAALNETLSYGQTGGWGHSELLAESYNNPRVGKAMAAAAGPGGAAAIGLIKTGLNVMNAATTGYEHYQHVKNASYTSVSGSFTSCAAWNYPFTPYVKITRPHKQIPTGGKGDYKHTSAIPLVETRNLSGAPGLTTCVNPDVSGITNATAQEKDIIYRALVNGVIV